MHSVRFEPTKMILIGTGTTYQATEDALREEIRGYKGSRERCYPEVSVDENLSQILLSGIYSSLGQYPVFMFGGWYCDVVPEPRAANQALTCATLQTTPRSGYRYCLCHVERKKQQYALAALDYVRR